MTTSKRLIDTTAIKFIRHSQAKAKERGLIETQLDRPPSDPNVSVKKDEWFRLIVESDNRISRVPSLSIEPDREMYRRSALGKAGLTETSQFFSPRNAIALSELWTAISEVKDEATRQKLRFAFTAILPRASRRYQWSAKRPLNAQNQTYYISPVYYEWNIFALFGRKVEAALRADSILSGAAEAPLFAEEQSRDVTYDLASADHLQHLKDSSVDYVFTDPPFGSNIFYSDMSLFHEAWLGKIVSSSQAARRRSANSLVTPSFA